MPTTYRNLLRCTIQVATWLLLLVVAFGSRSQFGVCTADTCCGAADATSTCGCCGCCAQALPPTGTPGAPTADHTLPTLLAQGCTDCRLDLSLPLQPAPLPRPVHAPNPAPIALAPCGAAPDQGPAAAAACPGPFDTGPPRSDRRTELLATTILRR